MVLRVVNIGYFILPIFSLHPVREIQTKLKLICNAEKQANLTVSEPCRDGLRFSSTQIFSNIPGRYGCWCDFENNFKRFGQTASPVSPLDRKCKEVFHALNCIEHQEDCDLRKEPLDLQVDYHYPNIGLVLAGLVNLADACEDANVGSIKAAKFCTVELDFLRSFLPYVFQIVTETKFIHNTHDGFFDFESSCGLKSSVQTGGRSEDFYGYGGIGFDVSLDDLVLDDLETADALFEDLESINLELNEKFKEHVSGVELFHDVQLSTKTIKAKKMKCCGDFPVPKEYNSALHSCCSGTVSEIGACV